jgi:hypothetical protein
MNLQIIANSPNTNTKTIKRSEKISLYLLFGDILFFALLLMCMQMYELNLNYQQ